MRKFQNKCYLHIGSPKTGSSALQHFFAENRDLLLKHNYNYPYPGPLKGDMAGGDGNAKSILKAIRSDDYQLARELNETLLQAIETNNVIISAEDLFNRAYVDGFKVMKVIFDRMPLKILLYVRLQSEIFQSAIKQRIRNHYKKDYEIPHEFYTKFDWFNCANLWSSVFGKNNIIVRKYRSQSDIDLIEQDFLDAIACKIKILSVVKDIALTNASLSPIKLEFMRLLNQLELNEEVHSSIKQYLIDDFDPIVEAESWNLPNEVVIEIDKFFQKSNDQLLVNYGVQISP